MGVRTKSDNAGRALGRPRNPAVNEAILRAALELFIEHGVTGASIERIAKHAGVAKTSIYRRWSSREELLAEAIEVFRNATGFTIDLLDRTQPHDFVKLLLGACEVIARPEIRKLMARLIGSLPDYPRLLEVHHEAYYLPRRLALLRALQRVQAAGLLAENVDLEALADMLIGGVMHLLLMALPGEASVGELRGRMTRLLRQAGFDLPV
jgi:AcrR family transcriptional regulator